MTWLHRKSADPLLPGGQAAEEIPPPVLPEPAPPPPPEARLGCRNIRADDGDPCGSGPIIIRKDPS